MRNNERYPEGYKPKIEYWNSKYYESLLNGIKAYEVGNVVEGARWHEEAERAMEKVSYFMRREEERTEPKGIDSYWL